MPRKVTYKGEEWIVIEHLQEYRCMTLKRVDRDEFLIGIKESEVEMTTTKLTHDEASHLRAFRSGGLVVTDVPAWMCSLSMAGLIEMPFISHQRWGCKITDAGREALAEYDREWVTVNRTDLEDALDSLEYHLDDIERNFPDQKELYDARVSTANNIRAALEGK